MSDSNTPTRPILSVAVSAKSDLDRLMLARALDKLVQQDPALKVERSPTENRTIISGTGEAHLETICNRLLHDYQVGIVVGEPEVVYLETIGHQAEAEVKLTGPNQYAHVALRLEPLPAGSGFQFINATAGGALPARFVEPVSWGIQAAMQRGILGNEVVDLRAVLQGGSYHEGDSDGPAFETAGAMAFKEAVSKASPVLLEPMMFVEAVVPDDVAGTVIGDLSSRRAHLQSLERVSNSHVIRAAVPLAEIIGYADDLRKSTQGESRLFMYFLRYDPVPADGKSEADEAGVTANRPTPPMAGSGSAAAQP